MEDEFCAFLALEPEDHDPPTQGVSDTVAEVACAVCADDEFSMLLDSSDAVVSELHSTGLGLAIRSYI